MNNIFKKSAVILLLAAIMNFSACSATDALKSFFNKNSTTSVSETTAETTTVTTASETQAESLNDDSEYPLSAYEHLSDKDKAAYVLLLSAIRSENGSVSESAAEFKSEIFDRVYYYAVLVDHPEYFYIQGYSESFSSGSKIVRADFRFKRIYTAEKAQQITDKIDAIIDNIRRELGENPSDYDKASAAYNYLIDNCDYDEACGSGKVDSQQDSASTMEGALIDKSAVCTGYSRAYKYMLNKLGLKCSVVDTKDHEWNIVMLDGEYYYTDVTWGDTSSDRYAYFCITTKQLKKNHTLPENNDLPLCTATKDNYYYHSK